MLCLRIICLCCLGGVGSGVAFCWVSIDLRLEWYLVFAVYCCLWFDGACDCFGGVVRLETSVNSVVVVQFLFLC